MKKIITSAILLIITFSIYAQNWNYVSSTGTSFILYGMSFAPGQSNVGYACGMEYTYNADGVIVKTTDGGNNWTQIWPASGVIDGLQGIWFISETVGFAGGWNNYFIKTTDGGTTWSNVSCGTNVWYYTDVEFYDSNNGVACAYMNATDQCVFITSDGGNTWTPATSGVQGNMMAISYADQNTLFAVNTTGNVYKSVDGGHNWTVSTTLPALLFGVDFADANFGVVGGEEKMFATNDGGATWTTYTTGYENFYAAQAFSDGTAYIGGTDENIYVTTDYGSTWSMEHNGTGTSHLYRIRYTPNGNLTACGSQGTIIQRAPVLTAGFTADNTEICEGDVVNFTDQSIGAATSWTWTFEGGTPATSTQQNPSVTYNGSGTFDVTLEVSDGNLTHTLIEADYIVVSAIPAQASTPVGPDEICGNNTYDYTTAPVAGADTYQWSVSPVDAGTISGSSTIGTLDAADDWTGSFTITVRAENACGDGPYSAGLQGTLYHNPEVFFITGGGGYCDGSNGQELILDGSETGIDYELFLDNVSTGTVLPGTGDSLSFGYHTAEGLYSVEGFNANCTQLMFGQAYVFMLDMPEEPETPVGDDEVCNNANTLYTTTGSQHADTVIWVLNPAEAGLLTPGTDMVEVDWSDTYTGMASLSLYGRNDCGDGPSSPEFEISVNESPAPEIDGLQLVCEDDVAAYSTQDNTGNTYDWYVEGGSIISGSGTHQVSVQWGSYGTGILRVTEDNGVCAETTDNFEVQIDECTSIPELSAEDFLVYPNPASNAVNIEYTGEYHSTIEYEIVNLQSSVMEIRKLKTAETKISIDVTDYPSGIYFIKILSENQIHNQIRFIVNH